MLNVIEIQKDGGGVAEGKLGDLVAQVGLNAEITVHQGPWTRSSVLI